MRPPEIITVRPDGAVWRVKGRVDGTQGRSKEQAVWLGRQLAQKHRPARLMIYREDGSLEADFHFD